MVKKKEEAQKHEAFHKKTLEDHHVSDDLECQCRIRINKRYYQKKMTKAIKVISECFTDTEAPPLQKKKKNTTGSVVDEDGPLITAIKPRSQ